MGNERDIIQVRPVARWGVVISIREGSADALRELLSQQRSVDFWTEMIEASDESSALTPDGKGSAFDPSEKPKFVIYTNSKMRCGYEAFCDHIAKAARFLDDALFFIGDEEDYIDRFEIRNGQFFYHRVHSGGFRPLDDYLREKFPGISFAE